MSLLTDAVSGLLSATVATAVIALVSAAWRRLSSRRTARRTAVDAAPCGTRMLRRYTLLRSTGPDGTPYRYETTRPTGTVITHRVDGLSQCFELTDVPLGDGTFAAEPLDHL
jgi:hypothetical protein